MEKNIKDFLDYSKKNWQTIIIIILVLYIAQKDFKIFSVLFSFLPIKIEVSNEAPKSTDWMQAIWWVASLFLAFIVWYLTVIFNKNTEIQNKLSFEEFRPVIDITTTDGKINIKNIWKFEAKELLYYYKYYDSKNGKFSDIQKNTSFESFVLSPNSTKEINLSINEYHSFILIYKNHASWLVYVNWFNFDYWNKQILSIWDNIKDINDNDILSPIDKVDYLNFINAINIKNQIVDKKIDVNNEIKKFISTL